MNDIIITWIRNHRINGTSWDWIRTAGQQNDEELQNFLRSREQYDFWDSLTPDEWRELVDEQQRQEEIRDRRNDESGATVLGNVQEDNAIIIPPEKVSAWQCYKRKLRNDGYGEQTIEAIESSSIRILRHLSRDTTQIGPIKGLVVGNVQSGKTANMTALMAMAADNGWNMFIILSGTINSLREQTIKRITNDLFGPDEKFRSRLTWQHIDNPRGSEQVGRRVENFNFGTDSNLRYFAVCIKNRNILNNLLGWLRRGGEVRQRIKLLIIDDEADQAGINTNPEYRTRINNLILNLVNGKDQEGNIVDNPFRAVNYIGYTATPYANVLNEGPGPNSLYPSNFIATLVASDEYFGPQQIFGCPDTDYTGLDIVRTIADDQIQAIRDIHDTNSTDIPENLKDAICWFLCGVSCMRLRKYTKPISMLIHTSIRTDHHNAIAQAIERWIKSTPSQDILCACRTIWNTERNTFDVNAFRAQYPKYNKSNGDANIDPLPVFDEISDGITKLLKIGITQILIDKEQEPQFSNGIHLCIDNSERQNNQDIQRRLLYPDSSSMRESAPAFIVVGGQTLSRGLTIEGLISTFFLRSSSNSDTLMQMGRWFGYRRKYELLPRIWMSEKARAQFEFISEMDYKLRQEIKEMADIGTNFSEVGPRIITSPRANLIKIVSSNRMRGAIAVNFDFSGRTMETGVFTNDGNMLRRNLEITSQFINDLGAPSGKRHVNSHNYLWENVELATILEFIRDYRYSERLRGFNEIDPLIGWLEQVTRDELIGNWNVILAGKQNGENRWEPVEGISVVKIEHTQRGQRHGNTINIGVLRNPDDFMTDIPIDSQQDGQAVKPATHKLTDINNFRNRYGLDQTPQLIIYVINKDSQPRPGAKNRFPIDANEDVVGFCINIPGSRVGRNAVRAVRININNDITDINDD